MPSTLLTELFPQSLFIYFEMKFSLSDILVGILANGCQLYASILIHLPIPQFPEQPLPILDCLIDYFPPQSPSLDCLSLATVARSLS